MTLPQHVVVMAKAPVMGAVKRRLAHDIGAGAALRFYRRSLHATLAQVCRSPQWTTWLAVTPQTDVRWCANLPQAPDIVIGQGSGDLGRRMMRLLRTLPPGPAVIVGADIPALRRHHITLALQALHTEDWVFGPANDGGYWLIGARRRPADPAFLPPLAGVRWSTAHALADTLAAIGADRGTPAIAFLPELTDIDTADDLAASFARANTIPRPSVI